MISLALWDGGGGAEVIFKILENHFQESASPVSVIWPALFICLANRFFRDSAKGKTSDQPEAEHIPNLE